MRKKSEETQKNSIKRLTRKVNEGFFGHLISWFDFMKSKPEISLKDFDIYVSPYGRIGNRVYECLIDSSYKFKLYRKFKNATKAKKFIDGVK